MTRETYDILNNIFNGQNVDLHKSGQYDGNRLQNGQLEYNLSEQSGQDGNQNEHLYCCLNIFSGRKSFDLWGRSDELRLDIYQSKSLYW